MYVLVEEWGEYSGFAYEPHSCYETLEAAERAKSVLEYKKATEEKVAKILGDYVYPEVSYVIHEVAVGMSSAEEEMINLEREREEEVRKAKEARRAQDEEREQAETQRAEERKREVRQRIGEFVEWWNSGDPFFAEKRAAKVRELRKDYEWYVLQMNDEELMNFYRGRFSILKDAFSLGTWAKK